MILLSSLLNQLGKKEVAAPGRKSWRTSMLSAGPALGLATCSVSIRRTFSAVDEGFPQLASPYRGFLKWGLPQNHPF